MSVSGGFSFRLGGRTYQPDGVTCLYRSVDAEAMAARFLMQHGESDIVEEFPDIFRKRPVVAQSTKTRKVPKDNAAEPLLFPLH